MILGAGALKLFWYEIDILLSTASHGRWEKNLNAKKVFLQVPKHEVVMMAKYDVNYEDLH